MAPINYDLFSTDLADNCELRHLRQLLSQLDLSELIHEIRLRRKGKGRQDWPIDAMLNAVFAMDVLQHRSVSGFVRELRRNPALMLTLGFELRGAFHCDPTTGGYAAPSDSAFCRFCQLLIEIESDTGALTRVFHAQVDELAQLLPDFGQRTGYDGKSIRSHSTGKILPHKTDETTGEQFTSDPDATWGKHEQFGTDRNGKEVKRTKSWFGYTLHVHGDVRYELPIRYRLAPANESEYVHCEELIEECEQLWFYERCESFVADRGLDSNRIRKRLFDKDILAVIDSRRMWRDKNPHPDRLKVPTRPLNAADRLDTILHTEDGVLYCQCPETKEIRTMHYQGREQQRGTLKWACPAAVYDFTCEGRETCYHRGQVKAGAKTRTVRVKIDPEHLRNFGQLPPNTYKWQRYYNERSAMERIYSRVDHAHLAHDHFLRGKARLELKFTIGFSVMLARACVAVKSGQPHRMRSWASLLAA